MYRISICLLFSVLTGVSLRTDAATLCVDPADGSCFATIQAAIDAAASGDVILIQPNPDPRGYRENLAITTPGLILRGDTVAPSANVADQQCPAVVLDGCETPAFPGCGATLAEVTAAETRFERLLIRHGQIRFGTGANNSIVSELCVVGTNGDPIDTIVGVQGLVIERSIFQGGESGSIDLSGDDIIVRNNQLFAVDEGIKLDGDNMLIEFNTLYTCNDSCIDTSGDNARIENNVLIAGDDGIYHTGDNPSIIGNVVDGTPDANIRVSCSLPCTGGIVSGNRAIGNSDDDELIEIRDADNFLVENNFLTLASEDAILFVGQNSIIRNNTVSRSGTESDTEACITVSGNGNNLIENNELRFCRARAIDQVQGDNNTYRGNLIEGAGTAGIRVTGGANTIVENNTITAGHGEGIVNGAMATGTVITDNTVTGNRTDICNDGGIGTISGNTFDTGGAGTACIVN